MKCRNSLRELITIPTKNSAMIDWFRKWSAAQCSVGLIWSSSKRSLDSDRSTADQSSKGLIWSSAKWSLISVQWLYAIAAPSAILLIWWCILKSDLRTVIIGQLSILFYPCCTIFCKMIWSFSENQNPGFSSKKHVITKHVITKHVITKHVITKHVITKRLCIRYCTFFWDSRRGGHVSNMCLSATYRCPCSPPRPPSPPPTGPTGSLSMRQRTFKHLSV